MGTAEKRGLRLGVLVSGMGTTLQALLDAIGDGRLSGCTIAGVISSRDAAGANERAARAGLPVEVVRVRDAADVDAFSGRVVAALERRGVALAVQAGWLCYWRLPAAWLGRVINVHPALLPEFGGQGFFGARVHAAVLAAGRRESGATVHWVDNVYDHGPIIAQRRCEVRPDDTAESLAERVQALERALLVEVIAGIRDGQVARP
ncbi:MAG: phosphoribosylglycinamide formyltransferase [Phycisphaerae bacterium]